MNTPRKTPTMTTDDAGRVCLPFGRLIGWRLDAIAQKRPQTFCRMMRGRRRYYGDLREALDALFNGSLHQAAKREKATADKARRNRDLLDRART